MTDKPGDVTAEAGRKPRFSWLNLIGPLLLLLLLWRVDFAALGEVFQQANLWLLLLAVLFNLPMVLLKSLRWQALMRSQTLSYKVSSAYLAYFGSIFIGFLTPGRLGEFIKALHVSRDCEVSIGRAFSSVLVDRLFDLYMLVIVGAMALASLSLTLTTNDWLLFGLLVVVLVAPLVLLVSERGFGWLKHLARRLVGQDSPMVTRLGSTINDLRAGLRVLAPITLLGGVLLTVLAYSIFFSQCYLTALALGLQVGIVTTSFAVALGSLITLLPISISGLGTREATIIAYLGTVGIAPAEALGFSLLVFVTFYLGGGLMGAVAWWIKPVPLMGRRVPQTSD